MVAVLAQALHTLLGLLAVLIIFAGFVSGVLLS